MYPLRKSAQRYREEQCRRQRRAHQYADTSLKTCTICLDNVTCRGILSVCDHWFCFDCIHEWSKTTNTCPLCKERFRCIRKFPLDSHKAPTVVRVKDKNISTVNYHEDDYDVAMGLAALSDSVSSYDDPNDETFTVESQRSSNSQSASSFDRPRLRRSRSTQNNVNFAESYNSVDTFENTQDTYESEPRTESDTAATTSTATALSSPDFIQPRKKRKKRKSITFPRKKKPIKAKTTSSGWIDMSCKSRAKPGPSRCQNNTRRNFDADSSSESESDGDCLSDRNDVTFDVNRVSLDSDDGSFFKLEHGKSRTKRNKNKLSSEDESEDQLKFVDTRIGCLRDKRSSTEQKRSLKWFFSNCSSDADLSCPQKKEKHTQQTKSNPQKALVSLDCSTHSSSSNRISNFSSTDDSDSNKENSPLKVTRNKGKRNNRLILLESPDYACKSNKTSPIYHKDAVNKRATQFNSSLKLVDSCSEKNLLTSPDRLVTASNSHRNLRYSTGNEEINKRLDKPSGSNKSQKDSGNTSATGLFKIPHSQNNRVIETSPSRPSSRKQFRFRKL